METRAEKRRNLVESEMLVTPTERTVEEIDEYIRVMRSDDRY